MQTVAEFAQSRVAMKNTLFTTATCAALFGLVALGGVSSPAMAQNSDSQNSGAITLPAFRPFEGEVFFLERIALPPTAKLHVSLVASVQGAPYLPLAAQMIPARNGTTPFEFRLPVGPIPDGPYRVQAWIVANGRVLMNGHAPQFFVNSLDEKPRIRLKMAGANRPQPKPMPRPPVTGIMPQMALVKGTVSKLDRRALLPDAQIVVKIADVSRADAPETVISQQKFAIGGQQLPFNFQLPVRADLMKPGTRHAIRAQIFEAGKLSYTTDSMVEINRQNVLSPFSLRVVSAR